jgi:hypothetical protein
MVQGNTVCVVARMNKDDEEDGARSNIGITTSGHARGSRARSQRICPR